MPFSDRTFTIKKSSYETFTITLRTPPLEAQGLRLETWGGAFILSNLLHKLEIPSQAFHPGALETNVLELGAGTGLTGLSAAVVWRSSVILTDLGGILSGIQANIDLNASALQAAGGKASCGLLDWFTPESMTLYPPQDHASFAQGIVPNQCSVSSGIVDLRYGVILAADTMYSEEQPEILTQAIAAWLRKDEFSRALICYPLRVAYIEYIKEFWERMQEAGLEAAKEGQQELSEQDGFDDERLCEWSVWRWSKQALSKDNTT